MKCNRCGVKEATFHSVVKINNQLQKMDLCADCASKVREMGMPYGILDQIMGGAPMGLLPGLFKLFDASTTQAIVCPICKTTGEEFVKTGFVGCPHCYEVFEPLIVQTVKKLQQSDRHVGKTPNGVLSAEEEEKRLKAELQAAVDSGDYGRLTELSERLKKLVGSKHNDEV